ncbi:hypothetical protein Tco_1123403 [Tanacetum coccineum]|uniref:Uncharacterized protein n=1 Tax=Tanacetum coccineum TaxID=301880 RepID=A0ABQ5J5T8_9ASTR
MRVRLWIQQRHELPCASRKFQGIGCAMIGGEGDRVSNWTSSGVFGERCVEWRKLLEEEMLMGSITICVSQGDGDDVGILGIVMNLGKFGGEGVFVSSWVVKFYKTIVLVDMNVDFWSFGDLEMVSSSGGP